MTKAMTKAMTTRVTTAKTSRQPSSLFFGILVSALLAFAPAALAITLQEAKQQGLVGEQRDGYLGSVESSVSADVRQLISEVNSQRRSRYEQIAQRNGATLSQVQALAYEQAVEATQSGHYVQDSNGSWRKK